MTRPLYELPRRLLTCLRLTGPMHTAVVSGYWYEVRAVLGVDDAVVGFLLEQRLAEAKTAPAVNAGLTFQRPAEPAPGGEGTYLFAETLEMTLAYIQQGNTGA